MKRQPNHTQLKTSIKPKFNQNYIYTREDFSPEIPWIRRIRVYVIFFIVQLLYVGSLYTIEISHFQPKSHREYSKHLTFKTGK